jgi:predicted glycogen debranching enzyme
MDYIKFDKSQLVNLEYSLRKEFLRSNRSGAYSCSTIVNCNTRKYHGLLVAPQPAIDNDNHVLLSSLDETVIQHNSEFNLGIHRYMGDVYNPKGHKYLVDFTIEPIPKQTYRVGGVLLTKEIMMVENKDQVIIKYTLLDAHSPTKLLFRPFLAFRNYHQLSKSNVWVDSKYETIPNGITMRLYAGYTSLYMQFSKQPEYTHVPDWYYNISYLKERERGYHSHEDLFVPGFFEMDIKKGESIYFSACTSEQNPTNLSRAFSSELKKRVPRNSFENCLKNSAQQFFVRDGKKVEVIAGFPWFGRWGRDTFIALPGLSLALGDFKTCKDVIDTMLSELNGPLFPNIGSGNRTAYNSVDAPLWFFWSLQQYAMYTNTNKSIWKEYGEKMKLILNGFRAGTLYNIKMLDNGLVTAGVVGKALTWMDAVVDGKAVTPRIGMPVEINALWYNAMMFSLEVAKLAGDKEFIESWEPIANGFPKIFKETFWNDDRGYLADCVGEKGKDWSVRPNMIFAASLPYMAIDEDLRKLVVDKVKKQLLTPRGLRTLSPEDPHYKGFYYGDQATRDKAYHQGTVWPWLIGYYAEAYLKIHGKGGLSHIEKLYKGFEEEMQEHGIGCISEVFDGDPPYRAAGAISQAWSVAEVIRMGWILKQYLD